MTSRIIDARRARFAGLVAGLAVLSAAAPGAAQTPARPRAVPLTETVHGISLQDEYRWMEDPANSAEMLAFVEAENARFRALVDARPERAWFDARLKAISSDLDRIGGMQQCGEIALLRRARAGDRTPKLYLRDAKGGERLFLDPAKVGGNELSAFGTSSFSPDCTRMAVHVSNAGSEVGDVHIFDVATGRALGTPIPRVWGEDRLTFLPGERVLYGQMLETPIDGDALKGVTAKIAPLAGGEGTAVMGNGLVIKPENFPAINFEAGQPFVSAVAASARADNEVYVAPAAGFLAGTPQWRQVASLADKVGYAITRGQSLYAFTTRTNGAGAIERRALAADGTPVGTAEVLFAGRPDRLIKGVAADRDGLYIQTSNAGAAQLWFLPDGGALREVKLPFEGTIVGLESDADGRGVVFGLTGWVQSLTALRAERGRLIETGLSSQVWDGAKDMAVTRMEAISKDGTRVPLVVQRRKGATGRTPTIVDAYGGYGLDTVYPAYDRNAMAWLDKGGAFAYCGTRGGGERGREWHEGGRGPNKPNAMDDLAACARKLTEAGIAPEKGPLIIGGSMGGTLIPTAAFRDPSAFGAAITAVGVVNAARIGAAENGANQFDEMGNPNDPAQFRDLVAMDAYHMITEAKAPPPPSLMVIGLNDRRVAPWMTAKWVARARAKWPDAPIYLRGDAKAGHGIGSGEDVRRAQTADIYTFAWTMQTPR
ncbi:prolyl oligopeptidase family serine peptidase [Qipengyuania sediminis]|uniref:prolyl oligopeptidase family serine peptidase n=1 Tax=Qipengyuania sediminis TaxID=1532023 RepID=UPI00105A2851|nr:prolyl oligopeptidase family serine peptidase [Qipengyuania sediminis]